MEVHGRSPRCFRADAKLLQDARSGHTGHRAQVVIKKAIATSNRDFLNPAFASWSRSASIGERLRWLMEFRSVKQIELAEAIDRTQSAISNVVTNSSRRPNSETLLRIAGELQCSAEWLMRGQGQPFEVNVVGREAEKRLLTTYRELDDKAKSLLLEVAGAGLSRRRPSSSNWRHFGG